MSDKARCGPKEPPVLGSARPGVAKSALNKEGAERRRRMRGINVLCGRLRVALQIKTGAVIHLAKQIRRAGRSSKCKVETGGSGIRGVLNGGYG